MGFSDILRDIKGGVSQEMDGAPRRISVNHIRPNPDQPRREIDETSADFADLRESIRLHGLIQPVVVWQPDAASESFLLIAGERRWRAFRSLAGSDPQRFATIPAMVRAQMGDDVSRTAFVVGLLENVVREELLPGDRAAAVVKLKEMTGWSNDDLATHLGLTREHVIALGALGRCEPVVEALNAGQLTQTDAIRVARAARGDIELAGRLVGAAVAKGDEQPLLGLGDSPALPRTPRTEGETVDLVALRATALAVLRPKVAEMERGELSRVLRKALRELKAA